MKITCPVCQWSAEVPEDRIPVAGVTVTCRKCQTRFPVSREAAGEMLLQILAPLRAWEAESACVRNESDTTG